VAVRALDDIDPAEVIRFGRGGRTFAADRRPDGAPFATGGPCTQEQGRLAGGRVIGDLIECPGRSGRLDIRRGAAGAGLSEPWHLAPCAWPTAGSGSHDRASAPPSPT
jgi:nitrite reductase/ring-hydroxylating ferredoxin subunit